MTDVIINTAPYGEVQANNTPNNKKWTTVENSRKRGRNSPVNSKTKPLYKIQKSIRDYWLKTPIETSNPFTTLDSSVETNDDSENQVKNTKETLEQKPPPIYVNGVENIRPLKELLDKTTEGLYTLKILAENEVKIQLKNSEKYLSVIKELKNKNTSFHTYQMKQDKNYKVVLRNMHPSVNIDELKNAIEEYDHKVINITNIRKFDTKSPLPLFFVEIEKKENNKLIFEVDKLLNTIISFEPPRKKRDIPQCQRCQNFNHTKKYCNKSPVCVKCAGNHLTTDCQVKGKIVNVKCANCDGNHPASYKGCLVRKQLQQKLFPTLRKFEANRTSYNNINSDTGRIIATSVINPNLTFSQVASGQRLNTEVKKQLDDSESLKSTPNVNINKLESMMTQLITRMDTMLNLLTLLVNNIQK